MNAPPAIDAFWLEHATPLVEAFLQLRSSRPVLRELLIPDDCVNAFKDFHLRWDSEAAHCSVLYLSHKRNELDSLCYPLQETIFNRRGGVSALTPQYKADLKEDWYLGADAAKRQSRCNKFLGKFFEFHAAISLESHFGWQLSDMEAFRQVDKAKPRPDFTFRSKNAEAVAVSCKTLCQSPAVFDLNKTAMANGGVAVSWMSPYSPVQYLESRIREAAEGLQIFGNQRKVVLIQLLHPENFKLQLDDDWLDLSSVCSKDEVDGIIVSSVDALKLSICKQHWYREVV